MAVVWQELLTTWYFLQQALRNMPKYGMQNRDKNPKTWSALDGFQIKIMKIIHSHKNYKTKLYGSFNTKIK